MSRLQSFFVRTYFYCILLIFWRIIAQFMKKYKASEILELNPWISQQFPQFFISIIFRFQECLVVFPRNFIDEFIMDTFQKLD